MSRNTPYQHWTLEEAALDAALSNAAQEALRGANRDGPRRLEPSAGTAPPQFAVIGTLDQIAALVGEELRARHAGSGPLATAGGTCHAPSPRADARGAEPR